MTALKTGTMSYLFLYASHTESDQCFIYSGLSSSFYMFFFYISGNFKVLSSFNFLCSWAFNVKNKKSSGPLIWVSHHSLRDSAYVNLICDVYKCL